MSSRKLGVIFSYILIILESVSSILFTPFLIRCLGPSEYGTYGLVMSITSYLFLLDLGVGNALIKYMAKFRFKGDRKSEKNLMAITLIFYSIVAVVILAVGIVLINCFSQLFGIGLTPEEIETAKQMLQFTVLNVVFTLLFSPFVKLLFAYEKFMLSKLIDIAKILLRVGLSILALCLGFKGVAIVAINMAMTVIAGLFCMLYAIFKFKLAPKIDKPDKAFIKEIIGYSFFVFLQMLATAINGMVDHILLGALVVGSSTILAIYTAATQITTYFQTFGNAINGVLMPGVVKMVDQHADARAIENEMIKVSRFAVMLLGIIFVGFIVFGKQFLGLWAGDGYESGYFVTCVIMAPLLLSLSQSIGGQILWALNRHKIQAVLKIIVAVINIVFTVLLIYWKPMEGAAIGTAIAMFIGDVVIMNIVFKKDIGISITRYYYGTYKGILPCLLISLGAGFLFRLIGLDGWLGLIVNIAVMVIVYLITMLIFGMNKYEKSIIFKRLKFGKKVAATTNGNNEEIKDQGSNSEDNFENK